MIKEDKEEEEEEKKKDHKSIEMTEFH